MYEQILNFLSKQHRLIIVNSILISLLLLGNIHLQAFCIPTTWAIIVITICFINTIFYPLLLKYHKLVPFTSFINGISVCFFIYCIIFLEHMNLFGLIMIITGIGLFTFIPHFFAIQIIWMNLIKPISKTSKRYFLIGLLTSFCAVIIIGIQYHNAITAINKFSKSGYQQLDKTFMTEKILGMHFIYHTRFCEFDGWRPPKHEPILVIGMWLNGREEPLKVDLKKRIELYKKFFPDNKYKFECSCGYMYSENYHNDEIWK